MADHPYVPRRDYDTGEAPYTIRQHGHFTGCVRCGGSPLGHNGPHGLPWWKISGSVLVGASIAAYLIKILY